MSFNKIRKMSGNICLVVFMAFLFSVVWGGTAMAANAPVSTDGVPVQVDEDNVYRDGNTVTIDFNFVITSSENFDNAWVQVLAANGSEVSQQVYFSNNQDVTVTPQGVDNTVYGQVYNLVYSFVYNGALDNPTVALSIYNQLFTINYPNVEVPPYEETTGGDDETPSGSGGGSTTPPPPPPTEDNQTVDDAIEVLDNPDATEEEQTNAINDAVEKVGTYNVATVTEGTTAKAMVDTASILAKADAVNSASLELAAAAADSGITLTKAVETKVSISVEADADAQEVGAELTTEALDSMKQSGIDKVEVKTPFADISIAPDAIDSISSVSLSARQVNRDEIPASAGVPSGSAVVDLNATADGQNVSKFKKAVDVKVPYTLRPGDDPDTITVYLLKDDGTIQAVGGKYDPATGKVSFKTNHFSKYFAMPSIKEFADVEGITWAERQIEVLAGKGFINGKSEGIFDPNAAITRAEFAALLTRLLALSGEVSSMPFTDVPSDAWYAEDVAAAFANGVVNGNSATTFDPNGNITRQEMAVMIGRVLSEQGYFAADTTELTAFTDSNAVAAWAKSGVAMAAREEIVNGNPDGSFAPAANASRAEAAVMLYRLFKK